MSQAKKHGYAHFCSHSVAALYLPSVTPHTYYLVENVKIGNVHPTFGEHIDSVMITKSNE